MAPTFHFFILMHVCSIVATSNSVIIPKFSSILVFGDSTVDTGNNNYILTPARVNHLPYGMDFPGHVPTGRYSNGKLVPDFLASILNLKDTVPPFLDPNLSNNELLTGVCFASGGSGIDDLTAATYSVIPMSEQIEYFKAYVERLKHIAGENETNKILAESLVVICAGVNDFVLNFYDLATRKVMFTIEQYQDYLHDRLQIFIQDLYDHGCRRISVTGLPPIGCLPLQITVKFIEDRKCVQNENSDSELYNQKLIQRLPQIQAMLPGSRLVYSDLYYTLLNLINEPEKYGIEETNRGCCGSGKFEVTPFCYEFTPVCDNTSKYVFWDSVHLSEVAYRHITNYVETNVLPLFK